MTDCVPLRDHLPASVDGELPADVAAHVATCLRCQAEVAQYRRLARALRSLEPQLALVPLGLHTRVMEALAEARGRASRLWRGALIGAGGLLVAAGGTTAGILITRHRQRLAG